MFKPLLNEHLSHPEKVFENRCTSERVQRKINGLCPQEQLARQAASAARVLLEARRNKAQVAAPRRF